jgi:TatD DNase family protein
MKLIDTHAHLDFPFLYDQLTEVLEAARNNQVARIVTIGASRGLESNFRALEIAEQHDHIRCTAGIHPHDAAMATDEVIEKIRVKLSAHEQVVGIGETGLDYHYDRAPKDVQKNVFRAFLDMSKEVDKPVIIHSRDAEEDTLALLDERGVRGGILHCFTGSREFAEELLKRDFFISFSGIVTFKSAREILEVARDVPADKLLIETDSPYLAPVPFRGKKNQPAYVYHTAEAIAEIRQQPLEELAAQTYANACQVFKWDAE